MFLWECRDFMKEDITLKHYKEVCDFIMGFKPNPVVIQIQKMFTELMEKQLKEIKNLKNNRK